MKTAWTRSTIHGHAAQGLAKTLSALAGEDRGVADLAGAGAWYEVEADDGNGQDCPGEQLQKTRRILNRILRWLSRLGARVRRPRSPRRRTVASMASSRVRGQSSVRVRDHARSVYCRVRRRHGPRPPNFGLTTPNLPTAPRPRDGSPLENLSQVARPGRRRGAGSRAREGRTPRGGR